MKAVDLLREDSRYEKYEDYEMLKKKFEELLNNFMILKEENISRKIVKKIRVKITHLQ